MARLFVGQQLLTVGEFPLSTFVVNMLGTFVLCFLLEWARHGLHPLIVTASTVGFLGAFTTFSAVSLETIVLFEEGLVWLAVAYIGSSLVGGLAMAALGFLVAKKVFR